MSATVIDSLVVLLGLDPKGFQEGAKKAGEGQKKIIDNADEMAKRVEAGGKRAAASFTKIRNEIIGVGLAVVGATGLVDWLAKIGTGAAATDRLAKDLGVATASLFDFENAMAKVGGKTSDADQAFSAFGKMRQDLLKYNQTEHQAQLMRLGVTSDMIMAGPEAVIQQLSKAAEKMPRDQFMGLMNDIGINPAFAHLLVDGNKALNDRIDAVHRLAGEIREAARVSEEFQDKLGNLETDLEKLGIIILNQVLPPFTKLIDVITKFNIENYINVRNKNDPKVVDPDNLGTAPKQVETPWWDIFSFRSTSPKKGGAQSAGRPSPSPLPATPSDAGGIKSYLSSSGLTPAQVEGVYRGIVAESRGDPGAVSPADSRGRRAFGLAQWRGDRLAEFVHRYGKRPDATNMAQQLEFIIWELRNKQIGKSTLSATTIDDAMVAYLRDYEGPGKDLADDIARGRRVGLTGARAAVASRGSHRTSNSHSETNIGTINVHTKATDGKGVARDLGKTLKQRGLVANANSGMV